MASGWIYGCGYNVYVWLVGVVVRRYLKIIMLIRIITVLCVCVCV